ncbi:MAG: response regulator transcription factor [Ktedonobacteraceae bacterium]
MQRETDYLSPTDYEKLALRLLALSKELLGQTTDVVERISQEVMRLTRGYLQVCLHQPGVLPRKSGPLTALPSVQMQYGERYYGVVFIAVNLPSSITPLIPLAMAQVVADTCAWLFYTLEVAAYLQNQCFLPHQSEPLSQREQQVLDLMCQGHDEQSIAALLSIEAATVRKHREHIYKRLHVRSEHQAFVVAFTSGLYAPLSGLTPRLSRPGEESMEW